MIAGIAMVRCPDPPVIHRILDEHAARKGRPCYSRRVLNFDV